MKPFNLKEAKAGKPVCTRDGKDVRIICWDWKNPSSISIIALVKKGKDGESIQKYTKDGRYYADGSDCDADLFMKTEKHEGWANILVGSSVTSNLNRYFSGIFSTKEEAQRYNTDNIVDCVKIEWEE